jgi:hypothetical protein
VIIGFDDLFIFQNFTLFPSSVLGDLALVIRVSPDALVWCSCDPQLAIKEQIEVKGYPSNQAYEDMKFENPVADFEKLADSIRFVDQQFNYDKRFTQLNTRGKAATNVIWKQFNIEDS